MIGAAHAFRARRVLEALMSDTCVISRKSGETYDDMDRIVPTWSPIYTGPCRLRSQSTAVESRELAEQLVVAQLLTLSLPYDASADVAVDDVAEITTQNITVRIAGRFAQTIATARRFPVEVTT